MSWLTSRRPGMGPGIIDITGEAALCDDVNAVADATQDHLPALGATNVFELIKRAHDNELSAEERARLRECLLQKALASDLVQQLADRLFSPLGEAPKNAHLLLVKISDFNPGGQAAGHGPVTWQILSRSKDGSASAGDISLKLGGKIAATLSLRAAAYLPGKELPTPNLVQVGMEGSLEVDTGASLPLAWATASGSVSATAKTQGAIRVDYYSLHSPEQRFLRAVAEDIRALPAPWDLQAVQARFKAGAPLQYVYMETSGSLALTGSMTLAKGWDLAGATAKAGVTFDASLRVAGSFRIECMPADDNRVRVNLRRKTERASEQGLEVGVEVGLESLMKRVKTLIDPHLGKFKDSFETLGQVFDGNGPIADILADVAKEVGLPVLNEETRAALAVTFGFRQGDPAQAILELIKHELPMVAGFWDGSVKQPRILEQARNEIVERLGPLVSRAMTDDQLDGFLQQIIAKAQPRLKKFVEKKLEDATRMRWVQALRNAGENVSESLDSNLAAVKKLLQRFQTRLSEIREMVEVVAKAQVSMEIESRHVSERQNDLMLSMKLDPASADAQKAFRHFMLGSLDSLAEAIREGNTPHIELSSDGYLESVRRARRTNGFKVIFADFELGSESVFSSEVVIRYTLAGIEVMTRAVYEQRQKLWGGESRVVTFVNALHVAAAAKTRTMAASLSLSQAHEKLEPSEARFLDGLEGTGLLVPGTVRRAKALIKEAQQKGEDLEGQLEVALLFSGRHLDALLAGASADAAASLIRAVAIRKLVAMVVEDKQRMGTILAELLHELDIKGATLHELITKLTDDVTEKLERRQGATSKEISFYLALGHSFWDCAEKLVTLLDTMRQLYHSTPGQGGWTEQKYAEAQKTLTRCLSPWLKQYSAWLGPIDVIRPHAIAFMASLIALIDKAAPGQNAKSMVQASLTIAGPGGTRKTTLLT